MLMEKYEAVAKKMVEQCQAKAKFVNYFYYGGLYINGVKIDFVNIPTVTIHKDFVNNFADTITIEAFIGTEDLYRKILPNIDNLKGYLTRKQMYENSTQFVRGGDVLHKTYKAFLYNPPTQGLGAGTHNRIQDVEHSISKIVVQFVEDIAFDTLYYTWTGMLEMTKPYEALKMILDGTGSDLGTKGVNGPPADVNDEFQILIPRGTKVKDLAQYIQQQYGIFNHGIGAYIHEHDRQGHWWFVYPLFNNNRYNKEYYKLNIFVVPERFDPKSNPRTYFIDNGQLTFYTVAKSTMLENKPIDQLTRGTGIQVLNTIEGYGPNITEVSPNKQKMNGSEGLTSFNMIERKDGYKNYIQVHSDNNNMAALRSSIVGNSGQYVTITWEYANTELIQPGMPVKIHYLTGNELKTLYGTVHELHAIAVRSGNTPMELPYQCNITMRIYVTDDPKTPL